MLPSTVGSQAAGVASEVKERVEQFVELFTNRLSQLEPNVARTNVAQAAAEALLQLFAPPAAPLQQQAAAEAGRELQLVFRHDCLALGCLEPQCAMCQHNPNRRCIVNFDRKYLVNDVLKAKCGAAIRVEVIERTTGMPVDDEMLAGVKIEVCILDGNLYDQKFLEGGKPENMLEPDAELDTCVLLLNKKKNTPLLVCGPGGANDALGRVVVAMAGGRAPLPDLHVTDSSEAILLGRKPPFRLLVRAVYTNAGGRVPAPIRHAVSEGFVVATRRTRTAGKADIPSVDDHISKLEHMGKETVKKLVDIRTAAQQVGVDINIPENCILKVGDFKMLALRAEQDGHLRQRLQHVLKLSKDKWDEARDHAMRAVVADNRMRAYYLDRHTLDVGLLFVCRLGSVDLDRPVALLQSMGVSSSNPSAIPGAMGLPADVRVEATLVPHLSATQRELMRTLLPPAAQNWWLNNHPGWVVFPIDSEHFLANSTHGSASGTLVLQDGRSSSGSGVRSSPFSTIVGPGPVASTGQMRSPVSMSLAQMAAAPLNMSGLSASSLPVPQPPQRPVSIRPATSSGGAASSSGMQPPPMPPPPLPPLPGQQVRGGQGMSPFADVVPPSRPGSYSGPPSSSLGRPTSPTRATSAGGNALAHGWSSDRPSGGKRTATEMHMSDSSLLVMPEQRNPSISGTIPSIPAPPIAPPPLSSISGAYNVPDAPNPFASLSAAAVAAVAASEPRSSGGRRSSHGPQSGSAPPSAAATALPSLPLDSRLFSDVLPQRNNPAVEALPSGDVPHATDSAVATAAAAVVAMGNAPMSGAAAAAAAAAALQNLPSLNGLGPAGFNSEDLGPLLADGAMETSLITLGSSLQLPPNVAAALLQPEGGSATYSWIPSHLGSRNTSSAQHNGRGLSNSQFSAFMDSRPNTGAQLMNISGAQLNLPWFNVRGLSEAELTLPTLHSGLDNMESIQEALRNTEAQE